MDVKLEQLDIKVDHEVLQGTLLGPDTALPGILFVHGWGGSQQHDLRRAREAAALGCMCMTFDLRGHERFALMRETVTRQQNLEDLLAAYDRFVSLPDVDSQSIMLVGISYGGYLAALVSELRQVRWLALRSPALYKDEDWDVPKFELRNRWDLPAYRSTVVTAEHNRALKAYTGFQGDVLLVEAEHDEIVPHQVAENYRKAFTKAKSLTSRVIGGADHGLVRKEDQRAYTKMLIAWITEMVIGERQTVARTKIAEKTAAGAIKG